jgi:hypothetical protein
LNRCQAELGIQFLELERVLGWLLPPSSVLLDDVWGFGSILVVAAAVVVVVICFGKETETFRY